MAGLAIEKHYQYGLEPPDWCKFYHQSWTEGNYQSG